MFIATNACIIGFLTNDEIKHRILNVYAKFVTDVEPDRVSDWLVQEHVISVEQWQKLRNANPSIPDRCRALLSHLFSTQHPRAFIVVRKSLSSEDHYLLEDIDKQESESVVFEEPEKQHVVQGNYLVLHFHIRNYNFQQQTKVHVTDLQIQNILY